MELMSVSPPEPPMGSPFFPHSVCPSASVVRPRSHSLARPVDGGEEAGVASFTELPPSTSRALPGYTSSTLLYPPASVRVGRLGDATHAPAEDSSCGGRWGVVLSHPCRAVHRCLTRLASYVTSIHTRLVLCTPLSGSCVETPSTNDRVECRDVSTTSSLDRHGARTSYCSIDSAPLTHSHRWP